MMDPIVFEEDVHPEVRFFGPLKHRLKARIAGWLDIILVICYLSYVGVRTVICIVKGSPQPPILPVSYFAGNQTVFLAVATIVPAFTFGTLLLKSTKESDLLNCRGSTSMQSVLNNVCGYRCATCCTILTSLTINGTCFIYDWLGSAIAFGMIAIKLIFIGMVEPYIRELESEVNAAVKIEKETRAMMELMIYRHLCPEGPPGPSPRRSMGGAVVKITPTSTNNNNGLV